MKNESHHEGGHAKEWNMDPLVRALATSDRLHPTWHLHNNIFFPEQPSVQDESHVSSPVEPPVLEYVDWMPLSAETVSAETHVSTAAHALLDKVSDRQQSGTDTFHSSFQRLDRNIQLVMEHIAQKVQPFVDTATIVGEVLGFHREMHPRLAMAVKVLGGTSLSLLTILTLLGCAPAQGSAVQAFGGPDSARSTIQQPTLPPAEVPTPPKLAPVNNIETPPQRDTRIIPNGSLPGTSTFSGTTPPISVSTYRGDTLSIPTHPVPTAPLNAQQGQGTPSPDQVSADLDKKKIVAPKLEIKQEPFNVVAKFFSYIRQEAERVRTAQRAKDPEHDQRVNRELNTDTANFCMLGEGRTYEPPAIDGEVIASPTIISLVFNSSGALVMISEGLTHDILVPEGGPNGGQAVKIGEVFHHRGTEFTRKVLERATSVSCDFVVIMKDSLIKRFVDDVLLGIEMYVPTSFDSQPYYSGNTKMPSGRIEHGQQKMSGEQVMRYLKALPNTWTADTERAIRKSAIMKSIIDTTMKRITNEKDILFILRTLQFLGSLPQSRELTTDFNLHSLVDAMKDTLNALRESILQGQPITSSKIIFKSVTVVDSGVLPDDQKADGGAVQWASASTSSFAREMIEKGLIPGQKRDTTRAFEVPQPLEVNPFDPDYETKQLWKEYWKPIRDKTMDRFHSLRASGQ